MSTQLIFCDEAGDPGLKKGCSHYFVIACVVFDSEVEAKLAAAIMNAYKERLGWKQKTEYKFNKTQKRHVLSLFQELKTARFKVFATLIKKSSIDQATKPGNLYNETIRDTLLLCEPKNAKVILDGDAGLDYIREATVFFRKSVNKNDKKVIDFKFENSRKNVLVQLADLVAGSILRSTKTIKSDHKKYLEALKEKISLINIIE